MTTITIVPEHAGSPGNAFRAVGRDRESVGTTPGAALDALAAQLTRREAERLVVVIEPSVDDALTRDQRRRLDALKALYRSADAGRGPMSDADRQERERLFDAQFEASERRAAALPHAGEP